MPKVRVKDIDIFYRVFVDENEIDRLDSKRPTMIVQHGGMGFLDHLIELAPWKPFSSKVQVVYIDRRGCGLSDDGDSSLWTIAQFADDVYFFAEALNIEHPILAGVSSGGYTTIACAVRYPDFPCALILVSTEPVVDPVARRDAFLAIGTRSDRLEFTAFKNLSDKKIIKLTNQAANAAYEYDLSPSQKTFENYIEKLTFISKHPYTLPTPARINAKMQEKLANGYKQFDYTAELGTINCPVLWFAGEYDPIHPLINAQKAAELLPNIDLKILNSGAPAYHDRPDEFYNATFDFLDQFSWKHDQAKSKHIASSHFN